MSNTSNRQKEMRDLIDQVRSVDGWRVEHDGRHYRVFPPSGPVLILSRTPSDHRSMANARALLRRNGLTQSTPTPERVALAIAPELPAQPDQESELTPGPTDGDGDAPDQQESPTVVERAPAKKGGPGVHELLLSTGDVVYGCADPGCEDVRFANLFQVLGHRRAHSQGVDSAGRVEGHLLRQIMDGRYGPPGSQLPSYRSLASALGISVKTVHRAVSALVDAGVVHSIPREGTFITATAKPAPEEPQMPAPAPRPEPPARTVTPVQAPSAIDATNDDLHEILARAAGLLQRVDHLLQQRPDNSRRVVDLERDLAVARARIGELEEKAARVDALSLRLAAMEQGARLLLGGITEAGEVSA
jgi:DNA-binding transcriptional regulator YhcF (GntR family)